MYLIFVHNVLEYVVSYCKKVGYKKAQLSYNGWQHTLDNSVQIYHGKVIRMMILHCWRRIKCFVALFELRNLQPQPQNLSIILGINNKNRL